MQLLSKQKYAQGNSLFFCKICYKFMELKTTDISSAKMSDHSKQLAELKSIRDLTKNRDISAISADADNMEIDEFEGYIHGIGGVKYKHLRRQRFNITVTTREKRH